MSESLPFVETLADAIAGASPDAVRVVVRNSLHALIAHCRADRTGKQDLPVAANHSEPPKSSPVPVELAYEIEQMRAAWAMQQLPGAVDRTLASNHKELSDLVQRVFAAYYKAEGRIPGEPKPAPASASARAEAMRRLRVAYERVRFISAASDDFQSAMEALEVRVGAVLALPEPDECAPLRELRDWCKEKRMLSPIPASWDLMMREIDRLIAERGGK